MLVHAHPDDETLTTGGTIARYCTDPETAVTVVTCTLGEEGQILQPDLALLGAEHADQLGGYRIAELAAALAALGAPAHHFLGGAGRWRDTGMALAGQGVRATMPKVIHPRAFAAAESLPDQIDALAALMDQVRPQVVVTYGPDGGYGHPDHVRAHEVTVEAARRTSSVQKVYATVVGRSTLETELALLASAPGLPFRLPEPGELPCVPDEQVTTRIDVSQHLPAKVAALRAHVTQVSVWSGAGATAYALSNGIAQPVLPVEEYMLLDGVGTDGEKDLFAGLDT